MEISKLFEEVLGRPGVFIGNKSVTRLYAFLCGYWYARYSLDPTEDDFSHPFNDWIAKRFRITTAHNWADIILFMNGNDESGAFDRTKELWGEYKAQTASEK